MRRSDLSGLWGLTGRLPESNGSHVAVAGVQVLIPTEVVRLSLLSVVSGGCACGGGDLILRGSQYDPAELGA